MFTALVHSAFGSSDDKVDTELKAINSRQLCDVHNKKGNKMDIHRNRMNQISLRRLGSTEYGVVEQPNKLLRSTLGYTAYR
jgi:hypothetical protein